MAKPDSLFLDKILSKAIDKVKEEFDGTEEEFNKKIDSILPKIVNDLLKNAGEEIINICFEDISLKHKAYKKVHGRIRKRFKDSLELLDVFIELNSHIGQYFYLDYFEAFDTEEDNQKLETLIRIHVRGCQILEEINVLIKNGFADGAMARWRSLHELSATFLFLYNSNYEVIQMYNDYEIIESWKKAKEFNEYTINLGWEPIPEEEILELENLRKAVIEKYGKEFSSSYGWTMNVLPKGRRNIREIEKHVGLTELRAIYTWASENVHSGISGNIKRLGLPVEHEDEFLSGPSEVGLTDPVKFATYSLYEMTHTLLQMDPTILNSAYSIVLEQLQNTLVESFSKTEKK